MAKMCIRDRLKPFLYYAMLQEGSMLPDMLLPDVPVNINGYTPQNFSMQYEGRCV